MELLFRRAAGDTDAAAYTTVEVAAIERGDFWEGDVDASSVARTSLARKFVDASAELLRSHEEKNTLLPRDAVNSLVYFRSFSLYLLRAIKRLTAESGVPEDPILRTPAWAVAQQERAAKVAKLRMHLTRMIRLYRVCGELWTTGKSVKGRLVPGITGVRAFLASVAEGDTATFGDVVANEQPAIAGDADADEPDAEDEQPDLQL